MRMRIVVNGTYTYAAEDPTIKIGDVVVLPSTDYLRDISPTWEGVVTSLTSDYDGPCRFVICKKYPEKGSQSVASKIHEEIHYDPPKSKLIEKELNKLIEHAHIDFNGHHFDALNEFPIIFILKESKEALYNNWAAYCCSRNKDIERGWSIKTKKDFLALGNAHIAYVACPSCKKYVYIDLLPGGKVLKAETHCEEAIPFHMW